MIYDVTHHLTQGLVNVFFCDFEHHLPVSVVVGCCLILTFIVSEPGYIWTVVSLYPLIVSEISPIVGDNPQNNNIIIL